VDQAWWIALAALLVFGASVASGFHFDDYGMLQDPAVVQADGWRSCFGLWQTRPLTWLSFWLNYAAVGRDPWLWHVVNVGIHALCSVLLYKVLAKRIGREAALAGALLFAVHPLQAEAVDYVYARAILLCALFSLLALERWISERPWHAVAWFALAVLAKEECVTLPLALALYSWLEGTLRRRLGPLAAMLGIAAAAGIRVIAAIDATGMKGVGIHAGVSPFAYLSEQGIAILRYFGLLIFPAFFTFDPQLPWPGWAWRLAAWAVLLALGIALVSRVRKTPAAFWFLAGLILLVPSSSVFPAADFAADRRMYLPMLAFAPGVALLLPRGKGRWAMAGIALLALVSVDRTYVWASDRRLWSEAVALAPGKIRPRIQLARAVTPEEALPILAEAQRLAPENPGPPAELARVDLEMNRPAEALAQAGRALALAPHDPGALSNRGTVLLALRQPAAARRDFVAALALDPCLEEARTNLEHSGGVPAGTRPCGTGK
jgi:tetratricopeptide (TPR) repeat protein